MRDGSERIRSDLRKGQVAVCSTLVAPSVCTVCLCVCGWGMGFLVNTEPECLSVCL